MAEDDYLSLLDRAKEKLPETIEKHERFTVPEPDVFIEGKTTVIRNFGDIIDALRREPEHLVQYLLRELGTPGHVEGRRLILKAKLAPQQITDRIMSYTETFVICSECGRPDTHINKEDRILILECEACGAHRPVNVRKQAAKRPEDPIVEGNIYELMIEDVGKKGDGIARKENIIIYVPGTVKGSRVKVKINKKTGTVAFGQVTQEQPTR
ncbi:MAG TPA: translation initiation factor IF-2 subunit beta [Methanomassiliicoccales archaeon]|nr:translation initiation factor IF-2 subunit beta [Methanomassiliicoccales archaeon]